MFVFLQNRHSETNGQDTSYLTFWISSSFPERSAPIFVSGNQWIYIYVCVHTLSYVLCSIIYYELKKSLIILNQTDKWELYLLVSILIHLDLFMCACICLECMDLCVGYACIEEGLKRVWKPLELQLWVLWNAWLDMWVLGTEPQPLQLQKFSTAKPSLQPLALVWRKCQGIFMFPPLACLSVLMLLIT